MVQIFRKLYFWEYEDLWIFFFFFFFLGGGGGGGGGSLRNRTIFFGGGRGATFLYIIGRFKVKIQNGNIFLGRKFSNFFGYN